MNNDLIGSLVAVTWPKGETAEGFLEREPFGGDDLWLVTAEGAVKGKVSDRCTVRPLTQTSNRSA